MIIADRWEFRSAGWSEPLVVEPPRPAAPKGCGATWATPLIASGRPRAEVLNGLQNQMNLLRWRFIDQVPGGREAIQGMLREFPEITFPH